MATDNEMAHNFPESLPSWLDTGALDSEAIQTALIHAVPSPLLLFCDAGALRGCGVRLDRARELGLVLLSERVESVLCSLSLNPWLNVEKYIHTFCPVLSIIATI